MRYWGCKELDPSLFVIYSVGERWCDHFWDMLCFKVNVRKPLCSTICNDVYDSHILTGMGHKTIRDFGVL